MDLASTLKLLIRRVRIIRGLESKYCNSFQPIRDTDRNRPRVCILGLFTFLCSDLSRTVVKLELVGAENVYVFSAYLAHERSVSPEQFSV